MVLCLPKAPSDGAARSPGWSGACSAPARTNLKSRLHREGEERGRPQTSAGTYGSGAGTAPRAASPTPRCSSVSLTPVGRFPVPRSPRPAPCWLRGPHSAGLTQHISAPRLCLEEGDPGTVCCPPGAQGPGGEEAAEQRGAGSPPACQVLETLGVGVLQGARSPGNSQACGRWPPVSVRVPGEAALTSLLASVSSPPQSPQFWKAAGPGGRGRKQADAGAHRGGRLDGKWPFSAAPSLPPTRPHLLLKPRARMCWQPCGSVAPALAEEAALGWAQQQV